LAPVGQGALWTILVGRPIQPRRWIACRETKVTKDTRPYSTERNEPIHSRKTCPGREKACICS
jgi:hypothetical protein